MFLPLSVMICLSAVQMCMGQPELIVQEKVPLLGGWNAQSPDSPGVQEAAQYAVKMFNGNNNGRKMFKLVTITSAQTQVTNVINYKIDVLLRRNNCSKARIPDVNSCLEYSSCQFVVTFNPINNKHEVQSGSCVLVEKV